ncbi:MAG: hypothetical protein HQL11_03675 [Candidatus Omnitrophica bacterium]|nr:hypothetical protein [Candidatus Omnitrophota bacterium]
MIDRRAILAVSVWLWAIWLFSPASAADTDTPSEETAQSATFTYHREVLANYELISEEGISDEHHDKMLRYLRWVEKYAEEHLGFAATGKITVIFTKERTFRDYTGANAHINGLFDGRIHLPTFLPEEQETLFKSVLLHEYTHAAARELSAGACPKWVEEGFTEYAESTLGPRENPTLGRYVAARGELPYTWDAIDNIFDNILTAEPVKVELAYAQSYAAVAGLYANYSKRQLRTFLEKIGRLHDVEKALDGAFGISYVGLTRLALRHSAPATITPKKHPKKRGAATLVSQPPKR